MNDFVVLGTDTDVGKSTFSILWLSAFDDYDYWKPVETGESDSERVARLVGRSRVRARPLVRFDLPVAPPLAARSERSVVPMAREIAKSRPVSLPGRGLVIETFGGPFSPLNEEEAQISLVSQLDAPSVLIASSAVGAVGRVLSNLKSLEVSSVFPVAVVLIGPRDDFAVERIARDAGGIIAVSLQGTDEYTSAGFVRAAEANQTDLDKLRRVIESNGRRTHTIADHGATLVERDCRVIWHPYTALQSPDPPLVVTGAQDEFLFLADGRRVIDAVSSWWTILHGHRHPVLMQALADAATRFDHVYFAGVTHEPAIELAELMLSTLPWSGGRVFYSDDGSTAVEVALKMAYQYWHDQGETARKRFVSFEGGYHGDTLGAMAVGRDPVFFGKFEPLLFEVTQVPVSAQALDEILHERPGEVAGVIIEPLVQGASGMRMHSPHQLRGIFETARRHNVLFIADEVMTGGGRTGELWAHQAAGIVPDLVCAGKTIAGGVLPIAATLVAPQVAEVWNTADRSRTFFHGHSFTAHPLAAAVGVANWRILRSGVARAAKRMEQFWQDRLLGWRGRAGIRDVRIRGTIAAIELDYQGGYLADVGRQLRQRCLEHDVLLRPLGNVLYVMPPLGTARASCDQIVKAMEHALASALTAA